MRGAATALRGELIGLGISRSKKNATTRKRNTARTIP